GLAKIVNQGQALNSVSMGLGDMMKMMDSGGANRSAWDVNRAFISTQLKAAFPNSSPEELAKIEENLPGYFDSVTGVLHGEPGSGPMKEKIQSLQYLLNGPTRNFRQANRLQPDAIP